MTALGEGMGLRQSSLDAMLSAMRQEVVNEVKAELGTQLLDRVIKVLSTQLSNLPAPKSEFKPTIHVNPADVQLDLEPPQVFVTSEVDLGELQEALDRNTAAMNRLCETLLAPVYRTVERNSDREIVSMTERRA